MKLKMIAAAVAAFTALGSQAAATDWDTHAPAESGFGTAAGAVFDTYLFDLSGTNWVTSSVIATPGTFAGAAYTLYSAGANGAIGGGDDTFVGAWGFNTVNTVSLNSGSYYYSVLGGLNGTYAISSVATPTAAVPEPETYALLGAGLGIIGFVASRRRRDF